MDTRPDSSPDAAEEFESLGFLGAVPPQAKLATYSDAASPAEGLLALWKEWLRQAPKSRQSKAARIYSGLHAAIEAGAELTFELPGHDRIVCERWLGRRVFWWTGGVSAGLNVGIVGSRLKRDPLSRSPILKALRLSMTAIDSSVERVVVSQGTSLSDYVEHCAESLDIPLVRVVTPDDRASSTTWLDELIAEQGRPAKNNLLLSPDIGPAMSDASSGTDLRRTDLSGTDSPDEDSVASLLRSIPIRDRILALMSSRIFVLSLRRDGNWWNLLKVGFQDDLWKPGTVRAVVGQGLCSETITSELQSKGAVRWYLSIDDSSSINEVSDERPQSVEHSAGIAKGTNQTIAEEALIAELKDETATSDWLIHWTRAPRAEWAGESREAYLKNVVQAETDITRSACRTLRRIISERLIRATPGNTRAAASVVCLSQAPLTKLMSQRIFRQHRGRWDFEHYGIGIRTAAVRSLGGRPVIYGDDSTWESLPEGERPWFQPSQSECQTPGKTIDWTIEKEWRLTSELPLGKVAAGSIFVFCATQIEAENLRTICDWRVVSIEQFSSTLNGSSGTNG